MNYIDTMTLAKLWTIWAISLAAFIATFILASHADWIMPRLLLLLLCGVFMVLSQEVFTKALEASKSARRREAEQAASAVE
ncbi:hypothetical protein [Candidatus Poriferisodalis sp.]|uniref:hypothetical protein n=1 Tax=Candidatus Poriferisodalis sp. TaxID=3101277 RepID=UPI003B02E0AC